MEKKQLNLFLYEDVIEKFDDLVNSNRLQRPSYFTALIIREHKKLMAERAKADASNEAVFIEPVGPWEKGG